ncbi:MAG: amino acid ABC transporter substrate-binding protein [Anaerolineae bacterium]|nr:amino acid ABC transporter substrate-binding protein [Anaerolineae bacterium]
MARVQSAGMLRVGLDPSWPPFEYVDANGEVAGLDVDLAHAIGERLGVEVQFVVSGWEGLYDALQAGQFDLILSALPYDPWRTEDVLYSTSYFNAGPVIVAHSNQTSIRRPQDLTERTLYVEFGAEGDVQARRLQKKWAGIEIVPHDTAQAALEALLTNPADAAVVDHVSARLFMRDHPGLRVVGEPLYHESCVIAMDIEAQSLHKAVDQALIDLRESGELDALLDRWL